MKIIWELSFGGALNPSSEAARVLAFIMIVERLAFNAIIVQRDLDEIG